MTPPVDHGLPAEPSFATQLLTLLTDAPDLDAFLNDIVGLAVRVVTPAAACGLTVRRNGQPYTAASSSSLAAQVDELQYGAGEGPCLQSLQNGEVVQVDDLAAEDRWPSYRSHALAHGVISSLSLPLAVQGQTVAALNLYSTLPAAFTDQVRSQAEAVAEQCAAALHLVLRHAEQADVQHQLGQAMISRSIVDQAIGILMAQQRCSAGVAFDLLRQASQHRNRKLRDIAADIITNVSGTPPQDPAPFHTRADE